MLYGNIFLLLINNFYGKFKTNFMDIFALEWQRVGSTSAEDVGPMARPKKLRAIDVRTRGVSARYASLWRR